MKNNKDQKPEEETPAELKPVEPTAPVNVAIAETTSVVGSPKASLPNPQIIRRAIRSR